jgi:hypothetical protein
MTEKAEPRKLHEIAGEIRRVWAKVNFAAAPYLAAMAQLETVDQRYGFEDGRTIVTYFLSNASTWRGEDARRIKKELKALAGIK